jgi:hypothetical protein
MVASPEQFSDYVEAVPLSAGRLIQLWPRCHILASHIAKHFGPRHPAFRDAIDCNLIPKRAFTSSADFNKAARYKLAETRTG